MSGLNLQQVEGFHVFDLLYWEQRAGNWAAQGLAEQDIVIEEICLFNNRLLLETLLSSDRRLRIATDHQLYLGLIRKMWPETLSMPINPQPFRDLFKKKLMKFIPSSLLKLRKKLFR